MKTFKVMYYPKDAPGKSLGIVSAKTRLSAMKKILSEYKLDADSDILLIPNSNSEDQKPK